MIISRTPFRVSLFGGGTDYPDWYQKEGGAVLSTSIDKYLYISARYLPPFFKERHRIVWSKIENVDFISDIEHPAIREGLKYLKFNDEVGLDFHYQADLPARSGMGSSSTFAVGMINAFMALKNVHMSKQDLAQGAIILERDILKEAVGAQDQVAAAYGGFNKIIFPKVGDIQVEPVIMDPVRLEELQGNLMLFYTGISRFAFKIAAKVIDSIPEKKANFHRLYEMVDQGFEILTGENSLDEIGELLNEGWHLKRNLNAAVSSEHVDDIYQKALNNGAIGGKLLGAGGSGFMLFYVPQEQQAAVRSALSDLLHVPFKFSWQGSSIIHYDLNQSEL